MLYGEHATCQAEAEYPELWDRLVGAWSPCLSPRGGAVLRDLSGRGNHGTLTNMDPATDWVTSGGKQALDFDGTNDYVAFSGLPVIEANQMLSISVWFRASGAGNDRCLVCVGTLGTGYHVYYNDGSAGVGSVSCQFYAGSRISANSSTAVAINNGNVRHVMLTREMDMKARCYIDGIIAGTSAGAGSNAISTTSGRIAEWVAYSSLHNNLVFDVAIHHGAIPNPALMHRLGPGGWATSRRRRWNYATAQTAIPYWIFARKNARLIGGGVS